MGYKYKNLAGISLVLLNMIKRRLYKRPFSVLAFVGPKLAGKSLE